MITKTRLPGIDDPARKLRPFHVHGKQPCELFTHIVKSFILLCILSSISLVLYTSFIPKTHWFRYPNPYVHRSRFDPVPTNISHILFGLGGSVATWKERSPYSSIWWVRNETRGHIWLDARPGPGIAEGNVPRHKISSPEWKRFKFSSSRSAVRIARIVKDSFKLRERNVRWFVMGDDDTVFFTHNLVTVLSRYDHNQMWYIGGNSESVEQDVMHAYDMAFGGGGFAISYPLAERLVSVLDGCLDRYFFFYGSDQRIWACIAEIGVRLTIESGFHQFDIRGSPYGIMSAHSQAPLVSLHHLDYLDPLFPNQTKMDSVKTLHTAYRTDPSRILQHTFFHDRSRKWSISVAWGYTVQLYTTLLPAMELRRPLQTFKTWRSWSDGPFAFNTRPIGQDPCSLPIVFMFEGVVELGQRGTLTIYTRVDTLPQNTCNATRYARAMPVQRITVSSLKMDHDYWTKERRRQCCQYINNGKIKNGSLQIRIRRCRRAETIST